jgi:hypothetical protein
VAALTPYLEHVRCSGLSRTSLNRHRDNLWLLGGEIIRRLHDEPRRRRQPAVSLLLHYIDDEGGPLIYPAISEAQQRSLDSTARKLRAYLVRAA